MTRIRNEGKRAALCALWFVLPGMLQCNLAAQAGPPVLSINDVALAEDSCQGKSFVFTVTLSHLGRQPVTVNFATSDGSPSGSGTAAVAGKDYGAVSGTLTFTHNTPPNGPLGSYVQTINVPLGNYVLSTGGNDGRTFTITLTGATNAGIAKSQGTGTLLDAALSCAPAQNAQCFVNFCGATMACRNVNRSATATPWCELAANNPDFSSCSAAGLWRDSDGDGLSDAAESQGYIDVNANGIYDPGVDVPLPGADPQKPDVYLHYDYTFSPDHSHNPPPQAIQYVADAFAAHGVNLHVDPQHNAVDEANAHVVTLQDPPDPACTGSSAISTAQLREKFFAVPLSLAYHHMVFAHYVGCPGDNPALCGVCPNDPTSPACGAVPASKPSGENLGMAEVFGEDAIIATQPYADVGIPVSSIATESWAGLAMHEFGHNFGLLHGGADCFNNKPNYVSVMSYSFYQNGIPVAASPGSTVPIACIADSDCLTGHISGAHCSTTTHTCLRIDYSDDALNALDEQGGRGGLNETLGLQGGSNDTDISWRKNPHGPGFVQAPTNGSPIDWNGDGIIETNLIAEINGDGQKVLLTGQNDWAGGPGNFAHLNFAYQCSAGFNAGTQRTVANPQ